MTKIRIAICEVRDKPSIPIPLTRHIVAPYVICREIHEHVEAPQEVVKEVEKRGTVTLNKNSALKMLGLRVKENEYVKVFTGD